jgi:hypothetical protein
MDEKESQYRWHQVIDTCDTGLTTDEEALLFRYLRLQELVLMIWSPLWMRISTTSLALYDTVDTVPAVMGCLPKKRY